MHQPSRESYEGPKTQGQPSESDFEATTPKAISNVLGNFEDFLAFISGRNENIVEFSKRFEKIEESNDLDALNKEILPAIVSCLQEEFEKFYSQMPDPISIEESRKNIFKKLQGRNQEIISFFQKEFSSFDEFYGSVLRAYTVNATLREKLFEYLQNEDWMGLNTILPYLFCLFKTFFNFKPNRTSNETLSPETSKDSSSLFLYKGDALDESPQNLYDPQRNKHFSWPAVASTSTSMQIAQDIMEANTDPQTKKYPVMFIIEIPRFETESKYLRYLDVTQYSAIPREKEVILPPGSTFEILDVSTETDREKKKITTIRIKLVSTSNKIQGKWQRKSSVDLSFPAKEPQWIAFSPRQNSLLEKAYLEEEKEVDLGGYTVSLQEMIQKKKADPSFQISIRRVMPSEAEDKVRDEKNSERTFNKEDHLSRKIILQEKMAEQPHEMKAIEKGMWQWKSQTSWVFYSFNHNDLIEEAYHQNRDTEIENYIVSPLSLIQIEKVSLNATTPIRRIGWIEDEETDRIFRRYFEEERPKSVNNGFGNLNSFLTFIKSRDNGNFTKGFEDIEEANDVNKLNKEIVPKIQECFQNEVEEMSSEEPSEGDFSAAMNSLKAKVELSEEEKILAAKQILKGKLEKRCRELTELFTQEFGSFQSFYGCILQAYTMETFLYKNLNKYLRGEDWVRLHALLPYLFCFCKAFFSLKNVQEDLKAQVPQEQKFLTFFRGVCLDEDALSFYDPEKMKIFYWTSLTSATLIPQIAEDFIYRDLKTKDERYLAMFKILIPVKGEKFEYLRYLDIKSYSVHPKENEVILPPASVFELIGCLKKGKQVMITLELKSDYSCVKSH